MEKGEENIDNLLNKLRVLDNRIHKLKSLADEVFTEVETEYQKQLRKLLLKKKTARQKLIKIKEAADSE